MLATGGEHRGREKRVAAMGLPAEGRAANDVVSERRSVEEIATHHGF